MEHRMNEQVVVWWSLFNLVFLQELNLCAVWKEIRNLPGIKVCSAYPQSE